MSDDCQKEIFCKNLNFYIDKSGKTQSEISTAIGVSPQTFSAWCRGISIPRMGKIQKLADYFKISKSDLIENQTPEKAFSIKSSEITLIEKYRDLDGYGKEMIDFTLLKEWERCRTI